MQQLIERLKEIARAGKTITYVDLGRDIGLEMDTLAERTQLSRMLTDVARREHEAGHPLLTAVVVDETGTPGYEFYSVAGDLGYDVGSYDVPFFKNELERVYEYWQNAGTDE